MTWRCFILGLATALAAACSCDQSQERRAGQSAQVVVHQQTINLGGVGSSGPMLYELVPPEDAHSIVGISYSGGASAGVVRMYATRAPLDLDAPIPLFADDVSVPGAQAIFILSDPSTRLLHYGERKNLNISFPGDHGLAVAPDERLVLEWHNATGMRDIKLQWSTTPKDPIHIVVREATDSFDSDVPRHLETQANLPPKAQLIWVSLMVSHDLQSAHMIESGRKLPLVDDSLRTTDLHWTRDPIHSRPVESIGLECVFASRAPLHFHRDHHEPSLCGLFGYYITPTPNTY